MQYVLQAGAQLTSEASDVLADSRRNYRRRSPSPDDVQQFNNESTNRTSFARTLLQPIS